MMDLSKLATLKQQLLEATDFFEVYGYFMDHFGHQPELMTLGEPLRDALFIQMLERIGASVVGEKARISGPFLLRLATHKLVHGAFVIGNHVGTVFYFEDVERGLAAFGAMDSEGPSQVARFSRAVVPGGKGYTIN